jgi:hypothetical protein
MAAILQLSGKTETLRKYLEWLERKEEKYFKLTTSINDEPDTYGNNVAVSVSQYKEEREAKKKKSYLANGRVTWVNDKGVKVTEKPKPQDTMKTPAQKRFDEHSDITPTNELPF